MRKKKSHRMSKYVGGLLESYFEFLPVSKSSLNDRYLYWTFGSSSNSCYATKTEDF